jgi:hypothetical protein
MGGQVGVDMHRLPQPAPLALELGPADLLKGARHLDAGRIQHHGEQAWKIAGVEPTDELVDELHGDAAPARLVGRGLQSRAAAVQSRLHGPRAGGEGLGDLSQAHVEDVLQDNRAAFLRRKPGQQSRPRLAKLGPVGGRRNRRLGHGRL